MTAPRRDASAEFEAIEGVARIRTTSGWPRVLCRFEPRARYAEEDGAPTRRALSLHVETTGPDPLGDAIVELAAAPFEYAPADGQIYTVGEPVRWRAAPAHAGDDAALAPLLRDATLVVAHGAAAMRPFVERRFPALAGVRWACSRTGVPWRRHGCTGTGLEHILVETCAELLDTGSAAERCLATVHILATRTARGELPLGILLAAGRETD